ncbi:iron(III) ABC superfamily ATP binding cassette transporter, binding domain protein [Mycobacterium xenopi 4042]|uniref:Iron(III) ABC superfamily ATP binding cassette transporter, binding domain protein n=1 Tax=Mycobacterium xenopi 4042 TaxID=1299334 RepID=X7Z5L8_MYCXE|nr:iron(III) ABC superfamily ATP binding cassette transporter, binding domain protein [Mycobacterium xenopi 4042]
MLFSRVRPGVVPAAAAVATAIFVTLCSGCKPAPLGGQRTSPTRSVITSTTTIAGAGVLGNQRRPDESCAPQPAPVDRVPDPLRANAAGVSPAAADVPPNRNASWCSPVTSSTRCVR